MQYSHRVYECGVFTLNHLCLHSNTLQYDNANKLLKFSLMYKQIWMRDMLERMVNKPPAEQVYKGRPVRDALMESLLLSSGRTVVVSPAEWWLVPLHDGLLHGCSPHERVNVNAVQVCHIKAEVVRVCSLRRRGGGQCNGGQRHGVI